MFRAIRLLLITAFIDPITDDMDARLELLQRYSRAAYEQLLCIAEMAPLGIAPTANELLWFLFDLENHLIVLLSVYTEESLGMVIPQMATMCRHIIAEKFTGNIRRRWMRWTRNNIVTDESLVVSDIMHFLQLQFAIQWHNEQPCDRSKVIVIDVQWPAVKDGWPIVIYLKHSCRCTRLTAAAAAALTSSSSSQSSSSSGRVPTSTTRNAPEYAAGAARRHDEASTSTEPRTQRASWAPWTAPWAASRTAPPTPPPTPSSSSPMPSTSSGRSSQVTSDMSARGSCRWCQDERHHIYNCPKMQCMDITDRWNTVQRLQLCPNCLTKHGYQTCPSAGRCEKCHMDHNTLLHMEDDTNATLCMRALRRAFIKIIRRRDDRDSNNGDSGNGDNDDSGPHTQL